MRLIAITQGTLKAATQTESQVVHDAILEQLPTLGRPLGAIGHQAYLDPQDPKAFLAIDTWTNLGGLQQFMSDPKVAAAFGDLFEGQPNVRVWSQSGWSSFADEPT